MPFFRLAAVLVLLLPVAVAAAERSSSAKPTAPRAGQRPPPNAETEAATYERCMALAKQTPAAARDLAESWHDHGGAHPADHCYAIALLGLKQYRQAATRLEALAEAMQRAPAGLRAEVLGQASQAWLLAGDPARAYAADDSALKLAPDNDDLLVDRAEAAGTAGWLDKAVADLDRVLRAQPQRVDALIYRASAYRQQARLDEALSDVGKALRLAPDSVPALLERGNLLRLRGDKDGARRDWVRVSLLSPGSAADAAAKANIERLELKEDGLPAPGSAGEPH